MAGSYVDCTGTNTSNKSDANMEHSDSQGSNDTIKITPQFAPHFKPKVWPSYSLLQSRSLPVQSISEKKNLNIILLLFFQGDPLRTLPLSRGGSVESLPARTQCLATSDSKRMSADLSELEPKMPFAPAGIRHTLHTKQKHEKHSCFPSEKHLGLCGN